MAVAVECSECGWTANVRDDLAGRKIKCKQCDGVIAIPNEPTVAPERKKTATGVGAAKKKKRQVRSPAHESEGLSSPEPPPRRRGKTRKRKTTERPSLLSQWHWFVAAAMILAAFLPGGLGVVFAGMFAFMGGLMFVYGMIAATIKVIFNDPGQALPMVVSAGARRRVQQRDDDDPFRQMITQTFMERGKTIFRGLILMVSVLPAILLDPGRAPARPKVIRQEEASPHENTVAVQSGEYGTFVSVQIDGEAQTAAFRKKTADGKVVVRLILTNEEITVSEDLVKNFASDSATHEAASAAMTEAAKKTRERFEQNKGKPNIITGPVKTVWSPNMRGQVKRDGEWRPVIVLSREEDGKIDVKWLDGSEMADATVNVTDLERLRRPIAQQFRNEIDATLAAQEWRPGMPAQMLEGGKKIRVIVRSFSRKNRVMVQLLDRPPGPPQEVAVDALEKLDTQ